MAQLSANRLSFWYPDAAAPALDSVSFSLEAGEFALLVGASGCGKTTLLRQFRTALRPHGRREGELLFENRPLDTYGPVEEAKLFGTVLQNPESQLVTDKVWHELAFALESLGTDPEIIRRRVAELSDFFGIGPWFRADVASLSGGQKQILNLASALSLQPSVLLLDEPESRLDPIAAGELLSAVVRANRELGVTVLMSCHEPAEILPHADRLLVLEEGRLVCDAAPRAAGEYLRKTNSRSWIAMPLPMRLFAMSGDTGVCPLSVAQGRSWLGQKLESHPVVQPVREEQSSSSPPILELREGWFRYRPDAPDILRGASLTLRRGEITALLGGNGAGKTTLLKLLGGSVSPTRGTVRLFNDPVSGKTGRARLAAHIRTLPQEVETLFTENTVEKELRSLLPETDPDLREVRFEQLCGSFDLHPLLQSHPLDLSGGERQRLALALAVAQNPAVLLLDEPTKGLDAAFRRRFGRLLQSLAAEGTSILLVSHDLAFCATFADRCALLFDGTVVSQGAVRPFFCGNSFYTTAARRMSAGILSDAIRESDLLEALGLESDPEPENLSQNRPKTPKNDCPDSPSPPKKGKRGRNLRFIGALLLMLLTVLGGTLSPGENRYSAVSLLLLFETLLPFYLDFEKRKPGAREIALLGVLCAAGIAGRAAFFMLPNCKPTLAVVMIAGCSLGPSAGFLVGSTTMLLSNFIFGHGPWTPWQMAAMGMCGLISGLVFHKRPIKKIPFAAVGALLALAVYGGIMNPAALLMLQQHPSVGMLLTSYAAALPVDLAHAGATAVFLLLLGKPSAEKLSRLSRKYGLVE